MALQRLYHFTLVLATSVLMLGACADPTVTPEERFASKAAYDSLLAEVPDSLLQTMPAIDSLFLAYRAPAFEPLYVDPAAASRWVDSVLAAMTLDEKIGQHFIVNLQERGLQRLVGGPDKAVTDYGVGGFLMPRLLGPREVFEASQRLQRKSRVPLFFAADYERGVGRFNNALTELPSNMALGATRDTLLAAAAGRLTAFEARAIGINLLFAPVVDVNNNPDNPIINIRSYAEDPEIVGRMAAAFIREAEAHGLLTTLKHFPGHGNTAIDSHARMGTIAGDSAALAATEIKPYQMVLDVLRPAAVMSAHLWIRALEPEPLPATFSRRILTGVLRDAMGFDGLIITDDVRMGALQQHYSLDDRTVRPLLAGADIILTPPDLPRAMAAIRNAVQSGRLQQADLDRSVRRILHAKARAGLHLDRYASADALTALLERPYGAYLAQTIADRAVTLLKASPVLPLDAERQNIAFVHLTNYEGSESINAAMDQFSSHLGADAQTYNVRFDRSPAPGEADRVVAAARKAEAVVLALYLRLQAGRGEAGLFRAQHALAERLLALDTPVVLLTFGNPYAAGTFSDADAILVAYDQALESIYAAARMLLGEQPARGRLPITVAPFPFGSGLDGVPHGAR